MFFNSKFLQASLFVVYFVLISIDFSSGRYIEQHSVSKPKLNLSKRSFVSCGAAELDPSTEFCSDDGDIRQCSRLCLLENGVGLIVHSDADNCLCESKCKVYFRSKNLKCGSFEEVKAMLSATPAGATTQPVLDIERNSSELHDLKWSLVAAGIVIVLLLIITGYCLYKYVTQQRKGAGAVTTCTRNSSGIARQMSNQSSSGGAMEMEVLSPAARRDIPSVQAIPDQEELLSPLLEENTAGAGASGVSSPARLPGSDADPYADRPSSTHDNSEERSHNGSPYPDVLTDGPFTVRIEGPLALEEGSAEPSQLV